MSGIVRTYISSAEVNTPKLNANELNIDKFTTVTADSINSPMGFISELTVDKLIVRDDNTEGNNVGNETYEESIFQDITLNFGDDYNGKYLIANHTALENAEDCKFLTINFNVPENLASRLTCRYLVLDLREEAEDTDVVAIYPDDTNTTWKLRWLYGAPDIQAGYFYVIAFQRLAKDIIVGNVTLKLSNEL